MGKVYSYRAKYTIQDPTMKAIAHNNKYKNMDYQYFVKITYSNYLLYLYLSWLHLLLQRQDYLNVIIYITINHKKIINIKIIIVFNII